MHSGRPRYSADAEGILYGATGVNGAGDIANGAPMVELSQSPSGTDPLTKQSPVSIDEQINRQMIQGAVM